MPFQYVVNKNITLTQGSQGNRTMELHKLLQDFDSPERKFSDEMEIESMIQSLKKTDASDENISMEFKAELIAFEDSYIMMLHDKDKIDNYQKNIITADVIEYWEERIKQSQNPVMIARYCDLVWKYKPVILKEKASHTIAQRYIEEVIKIANDDYITLELNVYGKLKKALTLAISLQNDCLIENIKKSLISYESKPHDDNLPGLWGHSFDLLIADKDISKNIKLSNTEEDSIINSLAQRFQRLVDKHDYSTNSNYWSIENIVTERLVPYYKKKQKIETSKKLLQFMEFLVDNHIERTSPMSGYHELHDLASQYKEYGLKEDLNRILIKINEIGKSFEKEGVLHQFPIEVPKEVVDNFFQYVDKITRGEKKVVLNNIAVQFILPLDKTKKRVKENAQKHPLLYLGKTLNFKEGRMSAIVNSLDDDLGGHIIKEMIFEFSTTLGFMLGEVFKKIKELQYSSADILDFIVEDSPIINDKNRKILCKAIDSYLQDDYIIFMHLAIPQIEAVFRNLIEYNGGVILNPKNEVYQFRILDDLLRDKLLVESIGEDLSLYYRVLLTDSKGWNLRNDICHGIAELSDFDKVKADRVFHALLCLGLIKITEISEEIKNNR